MDTDTQTDFSATRIFRTVDVAIQTEIPAITTEPMASTSGNVQCKLEKNLSDAMKCIKTLNERLGDEEIDESGADEIDLDLVLERGEQDEERFSDAEDDRKQFDGLFARGYGFTTNVSITSYNFTI